MREYVHSCENAMKTVWLSFPCQNNRSAYRILSSILCTAILLFLTGCGIGRKQSPEGWELTQYSDLTGNNAMCYSLIDRSTGDLILIDGGWVENAEQVRGIIDSNGGKVKAWILTHYHGDHAGAFTALYEEYQDRIETVYATPLEWEDFNEAAKYWDTPEIFEAFLKLTAGKENVVYLNRGDAFDIGRFHFKNYNTYDEHVKEVGDIPNNCSLVLKITADDVSMLFCGDVHNDALSHYLIQQYGEELKADIVQPGHHGNNSVSTDFYAFLEPKIMLFDAPEWLMTGENYKTKDLKLWCDENGVEVYDYTTAPNVFRYSEGVLSITTEKDRAA